MTTAKKKVDKTKAAKPGKHGKAERPDVPPPAEPAEQKKDNVGNEMALQKFSEQEHPAPIVKSKSLSEAEQEQLQLHESVIEKGKSVVLDFGRALKAIRDEELFREHHDTFEEYLKKRWDISRSRGYQCINVATVVTTLSPLVDVEGINERQARALVTLPAEDMKKVWDAATEKAGEKPPSSTHLQAARKELGLKPKPSTGKEQADSEQPESITAGCIKKLTSAMAKTAVASRPGLLEAITKWVASEQAKVAGQS